MNDLNPRERNILINGRFLHDLDGWTASGAAYSAGDGDEHYGVAVLTTGGDYVEQQFSVGRARTYTLHLSVKAVGADLSGSQATARIVDGAGNTVLTQALTGTADTWTENEVSVGLAPGGTYTLRITNSSAAGDVKVDDVWLWWVPITRAQLAARVHAKLGRLATDRSYSTTASAGLTEGTYSYAVDAGLRGVGAINPETDVEDVRYLEGWMIESCLDLIEQEMLERLERDYAVDVDKRTGEHSEQHSQVAKALAAMREGRGKGGAKVVMGRLKHRADDYELGGD